MDELEMAQRYKEETERRLNAFTMADDAAYVMRAQAIKEVMRMHGIDRRTAAALVDELIRIQQSRPIGIYKESHGKANHISAQGNSGK